MDWRPIVEAPTGIVLLVFCPEYYEYYGTGNGPQKCRRPEPAVMTTAEFDGKNWWVQAPGSYASDCELGRNPTFWRLLPAPPEGII